MNFTRMSFEDILKEERLREYNDCHNPGGPGGGQFCSKGGGGDAFQGGTAGKAGMRMASSTHPLAPSAAAVRAAGGSSFSRRADRLADTAGTAARSAAWSKAAKFSRAKQAEGDTNVWTQQSPGFRKGINDLVARKEAEVRSGKVGKAARGANALMNQMMDYGGVPTTRANVIRDLQAQGASQAMIDRYMQGAERSAAKTAAPIAGPGAKKVSHKFEYAPKGSPHMGTYRGMNVHTLPGYVTPYYYVDAPGFGSFHHTPSMGRLKNQINAFRTTGETPSAASKRKGSERYQKRKARYGR